MRSALLLLAALTSLLGAALAAHMDASATVTVDASISKEAPLNKSLAQCPPDIRVKLLALKVYIEHSNLTTVGDIRKLVEECSVPDVVVLVVDNRTLVRIRPLPMAGVGELKRAGINLTDARRMLVEIRSTRLEALRNITAHVARLEARLLERVGRILNETLYRAATAAETIEGLERAEALLNRTISVLRHVRDSLPNAPSRPALELAIRAVNDTRGLLAAVKVAVENGVRPQEVRDIVLSAMRHGEGIRETLRRAIDMLVDRLPQRAAERLREAGPPRGGPPQRGTEGTGRAGGGEGARGGQHDAPQRRGGADR